MPPKETSSQTAPTAMSLRDKYAKFDNIDTSDDDDDWAAQAAKSAAREAEKLAKLSVEERAEMEKHLEPWKPAAPSPYTGGTSKGPGSRETSPLSIALQFGKQTAGIFTIVRDEPIFLALWYKHYSRQFANKDMHVLVHVTSEDEQPVGPFADALKQFDAENVVRLVNAEYDQVWLNEVVANKTREMLRSYAVVLFAEADEFLTVPPDVYGPHTLADYIFNFAGDAGKPAVRCKGYEIHHDTFAGEGPLDPSKPILEQRKRWHRNTLYDKALLTKVPLKWSLGFHTCEEKVEQDEKLLLVHLHKYDFPKYLERHEARAKFVHSESSVANGYQAHYRKTGKELVTQYMDTPSPIEDVPEWLCERLEGI